MVAVTMKITAVATALALLATPIIAINPNHIVERQAANNGAPQNPNGKSNGKGLQFIGGACLSSKDCAENGAIQAACARLKGDTTQGQCSGICVTFAQNKDGGGFGDAAAPKVKNPGQCSDQQALIDAAFAKANPGAGAGVGGAGAGAGAGGAANTAQCTGAAAATATGVANVPAANAPVATTTTGAVKATGAVNPPVANAPAANAPTV